MKKFFFCPETLGLYPGEPYGDAIGKKCVELSESEYRSFAGHSLAVGPDDRPVLASTLPPTPAQLEAVERTWRDSELTRTQWITARHRDEVDMSQPTTLTAEQYGELLAWRQQLRDWPAAPAFPDRAARPEPPEWLAAVTE